MFELYEKTVYIILYFVLGIMTIMTVLLLYFMFNEGIKQKGIRMIEIYTRENCEYCKMAKELLTEHNLSFTEYVIGKDITRDEVVKKFPDKKILPIILEDNIMIGNYPELLDAIYPPFDVSEKGNN